MKHDVAHTIIGQSLGKYQGHAFFRGIYTAKKASSVESFSHKDIPHFTALMAHDRSFQKANGNAPIIFEMLLMGPQVSTERQSFDLTMESHSLLSRSRAVGTDGWGGELILGESKCKGWVKKHL